MYRIVPLIASLSQHLTTVVQTPEIYQPAACPHCGLKRLWRHGIYTRKADRGAGGPVSFNPIPIPRFLCRGCRRTCSRLPLCIAPRRWYDWARQQRVLQGWLGGLSLRAMSHQALVSRDTCRRWWRWLRERSALFGWHLRSRTPEWGRTADDQSLWQAIFHHRTLGEVMAGLDQQGVRVP